MRGPIAVLLACGVQDCRPLKEKLPGCNFGIVHIPGHGGGSETGLVVLYSLPARSAKHIGREAFGGLEPKLFPHWPPLSINVSPSPAMF